MNLPIFEKMYELVLWLFPLANRFPQKQRFVLGQQLQSSCLRLLLGIVNANQQAKKLPWLLATSQELDKLRILLRLSKDLKFISVRQYGFAVGTCNEVGKMLGGWIKSRLDAGET